MLGNSMASFGTIGADVHRVRRSALGPFFSTQAMVKFYPHMQPIVDPLIARMELCADRDGEIPLFYAYRCLTVDTISEYVFAHQMGLLDRADYGRYFYSVSNNSPISAYDGRHQVDAKMDDQANRSASA